MSYLRRNALMLALILLCGGCATPQRGTQALYVELLVIGTLVPLGETNVMQGDVALIMQAYTVKNADGTQYEFAADGACSPGADAAQSYLIALVWNRRYGSLAPRRTDWLATVCVPVDADMAKDIWRYAQHGTVR